MSDFIPQAHLYPLLSARLQREHREFHAKFTSFERRSLQEKKNDVVVRALVETWVLKR